MATNTITLIGNLTRDPELRYTAGGRGVASFGLAVNRRYQVNGEWQEQVSYFNIVCWADLGENVAATMTKGNRCIVTELIPGKDDGNACTHDACLGDEWGHEPVTAEEIDDHDPCTYDECNPGLGITHANTCS